MAGVFGFSPALARGPPGDGLTRGASASTAETPRSRRRRQGGRCVGPVGVPGGRADLDGVPPGSVIRHSGGPARHLLDQVACLAEPLIVGWLAPLLWGDRSTSVGGGFHSAWRWCCSSPGGTVGRCGCSAGCAVRRLLPTGASLAVTGPHSFTARLPRDDRDPCRATDAHVTAADHFDRECLVGLLHGVGQHLDR